MSQDKLICEHISVSRKQCWDSCQQSYKYRYHLKLIPEDPPAIYFDYGKGIHAVAEHYVNNEGKKPINEIANELLNGDLLLEGNKKFVLEPEYKNKFPNHIDQIKNLTDRIGFDGFTEWKFNYDLQPPDEYFITGFIDRLIIRGDKYFLLDYKTTKKGFWRKNNNTVRNDLQLRTYARVVQKQFGAKADNIRAALFYVEGGDLVATKFTEESLISAEEELLNTYKQIKNTNPDDVYGRVGDQCKRCPWKKICPFYSLT